MWLRRRVVVPLCWGGGRGGVVSILILKIHFNGLIIVISAVRGGGEQLWLELGGVACVAAAEDEDIAPFGRGACEA